MVGKDTEGASENLEQDKRCVHSCKDTDVEHEGLVTSLLYAQQMNKKKTYHNVASRLTLVLLDA